MRTSKGYLFRAYSDNGVSHHCLDFGRDSKTGKGAEKLYSKKKGKASGVHRLEGVCVGTLEIG